MVPQLPHIQGIRGSPVGRSEFLPGRVDELEVDDEEEEEKEEEGDAEREELVDEPENELPDRAEGVIEGAMVDGCKEWAVRTAGREVGELLSMVLTILGASTLGFGRAGIEDTVDRFTA